MNNFRFGGEPFHDAFLYLRSPGTDQLFLDRLRNGVGGKDIEAFKIVEPHKSEALPILVENLSSHDRGTREKAKDEVSGHEEVHEDELEDRLHCNRGIT